MYYYELTDDGFIQSIVEQDEAPDYPVQATSEKIIPEHACYIRNGVAYPCKLAYDKNDPIGLTIECDLDKPIKL